jgi:LysM repeat protein
MSKKDAVIIASLVNGAVLALLMILAVDVEEPRNDQALAKLAKIETKREEVVIKAKEIKNTEILDKGDAIVKAHLEESKQTVPPLVKEDLPLVNREKLKTEDDWYTVKPGDNPWKIAKSEKIDYEDILKLNQMTEHKAKNLKPGDRIRIR